MSGQWLSGNLAGFQSPLPLPRPLLLLLLAVRKTTSQKGGKKGDRQKGPRDTNDWRSKALSKGKIHRKG